MICEKVRTSLLNWITLDESVITWRCDSRSTLWCVGIALMYTACSHLDMMRTHPAETADTHTNTCRGFPLWPPSSISLALIHALLKGDSFIAATFALIHCSNAEYGLPGIPHTNLSRLHGGRAFLKGIFEGIWKPP